MKVFNTFKKPVSNDQKGRLKMHNAEIDYFFFKYLIVRQYNADADIHINYKLLAGCNLSMNTYSKSNFKKFCILTARTRGVAQTETFRISRIKLRELQSLGLLYGLKYAS